MAKNTNKAISVVMTARNELLKLEASKIITGLKETESTFITQWLLDALELMYPVQVRQWIQSDEVLPLEALEADILKAEKKQAKKAEKEAESVTKAPAPKAKQAEKPKKAESKPKAKKEAEKPKNKPSDKVLKLAKDIKKHFKAADIDKTNTDILAIAYTLDCSIKEAKKKDSSDYYKKPSDKVKFNLSTLAIDYLKQTA